MADLFIESVVPTWNGLPSMNVLIVLVNPKELFPTRPQSASNTAEHDLALRYFTVLPIIEYEFTQP